ncbi:AraC family transcriptional regulator [Paenibacillus anseongense]|uniref:AraC family transcriptional regulator n=1 Tax=Paenibacillus TaxID=44249 RepID=UPI002DB58295|nr:AraC family transcriptional regulator [Paenibacillus anseongense]MEC0268065.1 AraC family transcriptional regulator [Paenibacillus anseongense]
MSTTIPATVRDYAIDDFTNHFLANYPVHCELRKSPLHQQSLHAHNGYEFYFVLQGTGSYIAGDQLYPLHAGTLTVIQPGVIHRPYHMLNQDFHRYVLSIDESYMEGIHAICRKTDLSISGFLQAMHPESSHHFLSVQQLDQLQMLLAELEQTLKDKKLHFELNVLKCLAEFFLLLLGLHHGVTSPHRSEDEQLIGNVLSYLIAHYQEDLHVDDLLELFPVSRSRLFNLFKETTGSTMKQFLSDYRLNKAKRLLAETDLPVTEVAAATGFGDISHFFSVFKKSTALTPKQYRKETVNSARN